MIPVKVIGGRLDGVIMGVPNGQDRLRLPAVVEPMAYVVEGDQIIPSLTVNDVPIVHLPGGSFAVWDWRRP